MPIPQRAGKQGARKIRMLDSLALPSLAITHCTSHSCQHVASTAHLWMHVSIGRSASSPTRRLARCQRPSALAQVACWRGGARQLKVPTLNVPPPSLLPTTDATGLLCPVLSRVLTGFGRRESWAMGDRRSSKAEGPRWRRPRITGQAPESAHI